MSITQEEWCWKHKSVEIDVLDSYVEGVEFRQTGYLLRCSLSHAITLVRTENIQWLKMSDHIVTQISCFKHKMVMLMIMHYLSIILGIFPRWQLTRKCWQLQSIQRSQSLLSIQARWAQPFLQFCKFIKFIKLNVLNIFIFNLRCL